MGLTDVQVPPRTPVESLCNRGCPPFDSPRLTRRVTGVSKRHGQGHCGLRDLQCWRSMSGRPGRPLRTPPALRRPRHCPSPELRNERIEVYAIVPEYERWTSTGTRTADCRFTCRFDHGAAWFSPHDDSWQGCGFLPTRNDIGDPGVGSRVRKGKYRIRGRHRRRPPRRARQYRSARG